MSSVAERGVLRLKETGLDFIRKPIVVGGRAMEDYGMRTSGPDKDLWGDLGVVVNEFEIWRNVALLDYDFFLKDAVDLEDFFVVSLDRLLFMRVCAMEVEKYKKDLMTMKEYYYTNFRNRSYKDEAERRASSYRQFNGVVLGGKYLD